MIVEYNYQKDTVILADNTELAAEEYYKMTKNSDYRDELFAGVKQAVGQEVFDFLNSSERYKHVKVDYENVGPMGGKSVNISAWVALESGEVVPVVMNLYCDNVVYERKSQELLEAQEFRKSQEDIKGFLTPKD